MTIYDIPDCVSGISPFNSQVFTDDEFMSSYVTDRPEGEISAASTEKEHEQEAPATANAAAQPSNTASSEETMEHVHGASVATQVCLSFMHN